jgi:hypothetical protein
MRYTSYRAILCGIHSVEVTQEEEEEEKEEEEEEEEE